jgi:S1-C subfamily serine protease
MEQWRIKMSHWPGGLRSCILIFLCLSAQHALAQAQPIELRIRVVLIDRDLNLKPVPKLALVFQREGAPATVAPLTVVTGFDGQAEVRVPSGCYHISTPRPIEFQGKRYSWNVAITVLTGPGVLELSNDNAQIDDVTPEKPPRIMDQLSASFAKLKNSVVTVWSEFGHGTGFIVDQDGLLLTNQHVIGPSEYIAVQFDEKRKVSARVLAVDAEKDVAVLWADLTGFDGAVVAPLAKLDSGESPAVEGERVFTIGSPLNQRKIVTTGIVSKIESRAIISDININSGNSGGPLFNSIGQVVGITTFGDLDWKGGPGISGIIRIEEALPLLAQSHLRMAQTSKPSPAMLPVEPSDTFPLDAIKAALESEKFETDRYFFGVSDYDVAIITPVLYYRATREREVLAIREKEKRNRKSKAAVQGTFRPLEDLRNWEEYVGEYKPVILVRATPRLAESVLGAIGRGLAAYGGTIVPAKLRFKTDFYRMSLRCGDKEIQPIHPGKIAHVIDVRNGFVSATDATYEGLYSYPADAVSPSCREVRLEIFSEKDPNRPTVKTLDVKTVSRVAQDMAPYLARRSGSGSALNSYSSSAPPYSSRSQNRSSGSVESTMRSAFDNMVENARRTTELGQETHTSAAPNRKIDGKNSSSGKDDHPDEQAPGQVSTATYGIGQEATTDFGELDSVLLGLTLPDHFARCKAEKEANFEAYERLRKSGRLRRVDNHTRVQIINSAKDQDGSEVYQVRIWGTGKTCWIEFKFLR